MPNVLHVLVPSVLHVLVPSVLHVLVPSVLHVLVPSVLHVLVPSVLHVLVPSVLSCRNYGMNVSATMATTATTKKASMPYSTFFDGALERLSARLVRRRSTELEPLGED